MSDINWNDLTKDELIDILRDNKRCFFWEHAVLNKINKNLLNDFDVVIELIERIGGHELKYLNEETQRQIIIKLIKNDGEILKYVDERILKDKEFMLELLKINFDAIGYIACYYKGCYCHECNSNTLCDNCMWF